MVIIKTVDGLKAFLNLQRTSHRSIGFVPTLGALHRGHLSLIRKSKDQADCTVVSIFVNPTQFNNKEDLKKYPRTIERDIDLLTTLEVDVLFYPGRDEVYPKGLDTAVNIELGILATTMEGKHRPGHFEGVMEVVNRLLNIVGPDFLIMGQKDFQQQAIIRFMIKTLQLPVELVVSETIREGNGLAMSSRNERLSVEGRAQAGVIHQVLNSIPEISKEVSPGKAEEWAFEELKRGGMKPEYVSIVHKTELTPIKEWQNGKDAVVCTAVWIEGIRLIDNVLFEQPHSLS